MHVREFEGDRLLARDRLAVDDPLLGVGQRIFVDRPREAAENGAERHAAEVDDASRSRRQPRVRADDHAVERDVGHRQRAQAERAARRLDVEARSRRGDDEGARPVLGLGGDEEILAARGERDERLGAVEAPAARTARRARAASLPAEPAGVQARDRGEARRVFREGGEAGPLLRGRAILGDRLDEAERRGERHRERGVAVGDFLDYERVEHARLLHRVPARGRLHEAERPRPLQQGFGEGACLVSRARGRAGRVPGEARGGGARDLLVLCRGEGDHAAIPVAWVNANV